ncbi:MAG: hypothetical protein WBP40_02895 [Candidatus Moraniibacteriota bacterium]
MLRALCFLEGVVMAIRTDRYEAFLRKKGLLQEPREEVTPRELGMALIELGIAVSGLNPVELRELYPELAAYSVDDRH